MFLFVIAALSSNFRNLLDPCASDIDFLLEILLLQIFETDWKDDAKLALLYDKLF
jgi:hypothetical protein